MPKIYLKNGMVLEISEAASWKLVEIFFLCPPSKMIKVAGYPPFPQSDIVRDNEEIARLAQINLDLGVYPQAVKKKNYNTGELA